MPRPGRRVVPGSATEIAAQQFSAVEYVPDNVDRIVETVIYREFAGWSLL